MSRPPSLFLKLTSTLILLASLSFTVACGNSKNSPTKATAEPDAPKEIPDHLKITPGPEDTLTAAQLKTIKRYSGLRAEFPAPSLFLYSDDETTDEIKFRLAQEKTLKEKPKALLDRIRSGCAINLIKSKTEGEPGPGKTQTATSNGSVDSESCPVQVTVASTFKTNWVKYEGKPNLDLEAEGQVAAGTSMEVTIKDPTLVTSMEAKKWTVNITGKGVLRNEKEGKASALVEGKGDFVYITDDDQKLYSNFSMTRLVRLSPLGYQRELLITAHMRSPLHAFVVRYVHRFLNEQEIERKITLNNEEVTLDDYVDLIKGLE